MANNLRLLMLGLRTVAENDEKMMLAIDCHDPNLTTDQAPTGLATPGKSALEKELSGDEQPITPESLGHRKDNGASVVPSQSLGNSLLRWVTVAEGQLGLDAATNPNNLQVVFRYIC